MGGTRRDHHVVDLVRDAVEESRQRVRVIGVEGGNALRLDARGCKPQSFVIAPGENDLSALVARPASGFEPDSGAAADDDDGLPGQLRLADGWERLR